ncbi:hypothetical protein ABKN59_009843 [Abortiporus biennis]
MLIVIAHQIIYRSHSDNIVQVQRTEFCEETCSVTSLSGSMHTSSNNKQGSTYLNFDVLLYIMESLTSKTDILSLMKTCRERNLERQRSLHCYLQTYPSRLQYFEEVITPLSPDWLDPLSQYIGYLVLFKYMFEQCCSLKRLSFGSIESDRGYRDVTLRYLVGFYPHNIRQTFFVSSGSPGSEQTHMQC